MAALKTTFVFLLLAIGMVVAADETSAPAAEANAPAAQTDAPPAETVNLDATPGSFDAIYACNQFCSGTDSLKLSCCKAQGYSGYSMCLHGVMYCY